MVFREEIEESPNKTISEVITTTTAAPTVILPPQSVPEILTIVSPPDQPISIPSSNNNAADIIPPIENTEKTIDNDIITNTIEVPEKKESSIDNPKPYEPVQPVEPVEPPPRPTERNEIEKTEESSVTSVPEVSTSPKLVVLKVGEETATVRGHKIDDGSVLVDTKKIPKNEWTKIKEKPTVCQSGFEMDSYGACFGKAL